MKLRYLTLAKRCQGGWLVRPERDPRIPLSVPVQEPLFRVTVDALHHLS